MAAGKGEYTGVPPKYQVSSSQSSVVSCLWLGAWDWGLGVWEVAVGSRQEEDNREGTAGSKRGSKGRCKIRQNPHKIPHFKGGVPSGGQNLPVEKHFRPITSDGSRNGAIWRWHYHSAGIYASRGGLSFAGCAGCAKGSSQLSVVSQEEENHRIRRGRKEGSDLLLRKIFIIQHSTFDIQQLIRCQLAVAKGLRLGADSAPRLNPPTPLKRSIIPFGILFSLSL